MFNLVAFPLRASSGDPWHLEQNPGTFCPLRGAGGWSFSLIRAALPHSARRASLSGLWERPLELSGTWPEQPFARSASATVTALLFPKSACSHPKSLYLHMPSAWTSLPLHFSLELPSYHLNVVQASLYKGLPRTFYVEKNKKQNSLIPSLPILPCLNFLRNTYQIILIYPDIP